MQLLDSMAAWCATDRIRCTVTRNVSFASGVQFPAYPFPVTVLENSAPKGFGANHNQAFATCGEEFFCVLNPDIVFQGDPFERLIATLRQPNVGVCAPVIVDPDGRRQDSARRFPTPWRIIRRRVLRREEYRTTEKNGEVGRVLQPDWIAGMFMLFRSDVFRKVGGFDERYFMYCEDADICLRLKKKGFDVVQCTDEQVIHDARRSSHRSLRHLNWHVRSLLRFFLTHPFYSL